MIREFIAALRTAGLEEITGEEIADILWLASQRELGISARPETPNVPPIEAPRTEEPPPEDREPPKQPPENNPLTDGQGQSNVHLPEGDGKATDDIQTGPTGGTNFPAPAASALPNRLAVGRSLRGLSRRVSSPVATVFDEEATIRRIAEEGNWIPLHRPAPERWLDLALVMDESANMVIWRKTVDELHTLLERQGAFRFVTRWGLRADDISLSLREDTPAFYMGSRFTADHLPPSRRPEELIHPQNRRLILVISDCVAPGWYDGRMERLLHAWAQRGMVSLVQVLPEDLWERTGLGTGIAMEACALYPGAPNSKLARRYRWRLDGSVPPKGLLLPVTTLEPERISLWTRSLVARDNVWSPAILLPADGEQRFSVLEDTTASTPTTGVEWVERFMHEASPQARLLAGYLSVVPLSLPVIRLVQEAMMEEVEQVHLAEIILSDLLVRRPEQDDAMHPDEVLYDFRPGVREALLTSLLEDEIEEVLERSSRFVDRHTGQPIHFSALLADPSQVESVLIDSDSRSFATVSAEVLRMLGGIYAEVAAQLDIVAARHINGDSGRLEDISDMIINKQGEAEPSDLPVQDSAWLTKFTQQVCDGLVRDTAAIKSTFCRLQGSRVTRIVYGMAETGRSQTEHWFQDVTGHFLQLIARRAVYVTREDFDPSPLNVPKSDIPPFVAIPIFRSDDSQRCSGVLYVEFSSLVDLQRSRGILSVFHQLTELAFECDKTMQQTFREVIDSLGEDLGEVVADSATGRYPEQTAQLQITSKLHQLLSENSDEIKIVHSLLESLTNLFAPLPVTTGISLKVWRREAADDEAVEWHHYIFPETLGLSEEWLRREEDDGIHAQALATALPQNIPDVRPITHYRKKRDDTLSELDLPILVDNQVVGGVNIESPQVAAFTRHHEEMARRFARVAALAISNARQRRNLRTVLGAARAITAPVSLSDTLRIISHDIRQAVPNLSTLIIWLKDPQRNNLILANSYFGVRNEAALLADQPRPDGMVRYAMNLHQPLWVENVTTQVRFASKTFVAAEGIRSTAIFPLVSENENVGVMFFSYREPHRFTDEEKRLFPILGEVIAAVIRDALSLAGAEANRKRSQMLSDVIEIVSQELEQDESIRRVLTRITEDDVFPNVAAAILLYDGSEHSLILSPASLPFNYFDKPEHPTVLTVPVNGMSIAAAVARRSLASGKKELINVGSVQGNPDHMPVRSDTESELAITLSSDEKGLIGVFVLESTVPNAFDEDAVELASKLARQIRFAIERSQKQQEMELNIAIASMTAWAAEIANDIENAVFVIRSNVEALRALPEDVDNDTHLHYLTQIDETAKRLVPDPLFGSQIPELSAVDRMQQLEEVESDRLDILRTVWATEIAHDIEQEIYVIRSSVDALRWLSKGEDDETRIRDLTRIDESAKRLIMALPPESQPPEVIEIDLFLRSVMLALIAEIDQSIEVVFDLSCNEIRVETKPMILKRIFRLLVRNAAQAMEDQDRPKELAAGTASLPDNKFIEVEFSDNGPGIPPSLYPKVFQQRLLSKEKRTGGLGLLFVRFLVEAIGGTIRVLTSQADKGATFVIRLPLQLPSGQNSL